MVAAFCVLDDMAERKDRGYEFLVLRLRRGDGLYIDRCGYVGVGGEEVWV